jgi:ribonuclease P protein component
VYTQGKKIVSSSFILYIHHDAEALPPTRRIGIVVRKKIGNAPVRNRCKRLLREIFRTHKESIPVKTDMVVIVRKNMVEKQYHALENEVMYALHRTGFPHAPQQHQTDTAS